MGNALPKLGFHKSPTEDLNAKVTDGAYRFLQWLRAYCWDGTPFVMPRSADVTTHFAGLMDTKPRSIRNYIKELTTAGLIEQQGSSRGWEIAPAGMIGANASQPELDQEFGKNLPSTYGKNLPNPQGQEGGDIASITSLPPSSKASKERGKSDRNDGKNLPKTRQKSAKSDTAPPEFGKKMPTPRREYEPKPRQPEPPVDKSEVTAEEQPYLTRLEDVGIYGKNALRAVRKAIKANLTVDDLLAIAQTVIAQCERDTRADDPLKLAAWRLANRRLRVPTQAEVERDRRAAQERTHRASLIAELKSG